LIDSPPYVIYRSAPLILQKLTAGKIDLLIIKSNLQVFVVVKLFDALNVPGLDIYSLSDMEETKVVALSNLLDYCPLPSYFIDNPIVVLKHSI
jgi:hypothetical protein